MGDENAERDDDRRKGDELVRRMLGMRPMPQEELKVGKARGEALPLRTASGERTEAPDEPETRRSASR